MLCESMSTERIMDLFLVAFLLYIVMSIVSMYHVPSGDEALIQIEKHVGRLVEIAEGENK